MYREMLGFGRRTFLASDFLSGSLGGELFSQRLGRGAAVWHSMQAVDRCMHSRCTHAFFDEPVGDAARSCSCKEEKDNCT